MNQKIEYMKMDKQMVYLLVAGIYAVNYGLLTILSVLLPLPLWLAKLLVEMVLYPVSFYLQRRFVFAARRA